MTDYTIGLKDSSGRDLDIWDDFLDLQYSRKLNSLGRLSVTMPVRAGINPATIRRDYHLTVQRKIGEQPPYLDMQTWWIIDLVDWDVTEGTIKIEAGDLLHLLKRRIVNYSAGSLNGSKTAVVRDIESLPLLSSTDCIREFVAENLGSEVITDLTREIDVFSVQADDGLGPEVEVEGAWREVLQVCQDIANQSTGLAYPFYFDIVPVGAIAFEFQVFVAYRGTNRGSESINPLFMNSDENLSDVHLVWDYKDEKTYVRMTGEGNGDSVIQKYAKDASREYSIWGAIERYENLGAEVGNNDYFNRRGQEFLEASRPKMRMTASIVDAPGSRYGLDYRYGDQIGAVAEGFVFDCVVDSVQVNVTDGRENIRSSLKGELTL